MKPMWITTGRSISRLHSRYLMRSYLKQEKQVMAVKKRREPNWRRHQFRGSG
jgi:hypothetical protein